MGLVLVEGFDHWGEGQESLKFWSGSSFLKKTTGRGFIPGAEGIEVIFANPVSKFLPSSYSTICFGGAFQSIDYQGPFVAFFATDGTVVAQIGQNGAGRLRVTDSAGRTYDGTTIIPDSAWFQVELQIVVGTSGSFELHLNGATEIASTTGNFGTSNINRVQFFCNGFISGKIEVDDVYINNDGTFLGDIVVRTVYPDADGTYTQWTPDTGTSHYTRVNEHPIDGDASYVYDSTTGHKDSYDMQPLPGVTVYGVQLNLGARKGDAGLRQIAPLIRQSATDYVGATSTLSLAYLFYSWILDQDPTGSDWTATTVNGDEFGQEVIA